jgi:ABC-type uncharacterized transport system involved in gliding motility auxiliary subunit
LGLAVSYGGKHESIPFVQNVNDLEYQLTSFIKELTAENKPKVGFVSGHGEKALASDYTILQKELAKQFEIVPVAVAGAEPAASSKDTTTANKTKSATSTPAPVKSFSIPTGLKVLVIAGPTQDFSDEEKKAVADFIANGGSVFFMIDGTTISPENMSVAVNEKSLADFVKEQTGVEVGKDLVYDLKSNQAVGFGGAGQSRVVLPYPFWIQAVKDKNSLPIASKLENILLPWGSSLTADIGIIDGKGWDAVDLFSSSAYAGTQSAQFNITPNQKFSQSGLGQKVLALALAPKTGDKNQSHVIVVGSSNFISDQFLQNGQANLSFALDAFSWLGQESSLGNIKIKNLDERKLVFDNSEDPNLIKFGNLAFVFLAVSGYGTLRLWRRKKRKNDVYEA